MRVDNRCVDKGGAPSRAIGRAIPVNGQAGRLQVSFLPRLLRWIPFTKGDYWVLKIDDAYLAEATRQGFDLGKWITPRQSGRRVTDDLLDG